MSELIYRIKYAFWFWWISKINSLWLVVDAAKATEYDPGTTAKDAVGEEITYWVDD